MAKIGLRKFVFATATVNASTGAVTYSGVTVPGKAVSFSFTPNSNDATLYADDEIAERDTSISGGTLTVGLDRYDEETMAALLGHTYTENGGMVSNKDDVAPWVGFGRVVTIMQDGVIKYRASLLTKVMFSEPADDNATKEETTTFNTYTIEGACTADGSGDWRKQKTFDTYEAAYAWLTGLLGANS